MNWKWVTREREESRKIPRCWVPAVAMMVVSFIGMVKI